MYFNKYTALLFILLVFTPAAQANNLSELGSVILEEIWRFHPVSATYQGIHKYDTLLGDYSKNTLKKKLNRFKELKQKLGELDTLPLSIDELVDHHLLKINLNYEIFDIEKIKSYEKDPLIYVRECLDGMYAILIRSAPSARAKINAMKKRLSQIPGFLEISKQNLKHPPQLLCEIGIDQLNESEEFIEEIYSAYEDSFSDKENLDFRQIKTKAIAALKLFAIWLGKNGDPNSSYVLGKENYEYKLKYIHLLDISADSLLKIGKNILASTNRMIDSLESMAAEPQTKKIRLPQDFGRDDVLSYRKEEIEFMRDFVARSDLVTVPDWIGELKVVETPDYLRTTIPGIAMHPPGAFDDSNTSYFYIPPLPIKFDLGQIEYFYNRVRNRAFRGWVVHEGYPGHHLQLSIANHHPSAIRKSFYDYFLGEGWALYCEELIARSGLYEDSLAAIIRALYGVRFRAARVIVDVMLQTRQYSYEDAVNFMSTILRRDYSFYVGEVKRYITTPGQASSYIYGKLQILQLLDDYKQTVGDKFNLKDFHDKLLEQGSIPIILIRRIMIGSRRGYRTN